VTTDDWEWLRRKDDEMQAQLARELADAKARAAQTGKEPFDYAALCEIYDPTSDLGTVVHDPVERARSLESKYYVSFPNVLTLSEFAERMTELDSWR
jgi:hypothetical protein